MFTNNNPASDVPSSGAGDGAREAGAPRPAAVGWCDLAGGVLAGSVTAAVLAVLGLCGILVLGPFVVVVAHELGKAERTRQFANGVLVGLLVAYGSFVLACC